MVGAREGSRVVNVLGRTKFISQTNSCARRYASAKATKPAAAQQAAVDDIEATSSFSTPAPDAKALAEFEQGQKQRTAESQLPGNRSVY